MEEEEWRKEKKKEEEEKITLSLEEEERKLGGRPALERKREREPTGWAFLAKMFNWSRPEGMPRSEPNEEAIWTMIDGHDPHGTADMADRLEQHEEMLRGRSVYGEFFVRSSLLPHSELDPSVYEDPAEWVTTIKLQCGDYNPLESSIAQVSSGMCDVLEPAANTVEQVGHSRLLSHRQLQPTTPEWPRDSPVGQLSKPARGYVPWARYVLRAHKSVLKKAGIYEAVYASMFSFESIPHSWMKGVIEFWDPTTNTCWVGSEELTMTLWELQAVSGLPIFGRRYEECIPPDEELFRRRPSSNKSKRGELILPTVLPAALSHYRRVCKEAKLSRRSRATIPMDIWIRSFIREDELSQATVFLQDPFGLGVQYIEDLSEELAEPFTDIGYMSPALPGMSEELFLVGFLVCWLCTFVLPGKGGAIRCNALLAASLLSYGERLSLAPVVLNKIFRTFRTISEDHMLDGHDTVLPWQYIYAWVHIHIQGAFSCLEYPSYFSHRGYPIIMQLLRASSTLEQERVRLFFFAPHLVADRFRLVHQPELGSLPSNLMGVDIPDDIDRHGRYTLLFKGRSLQVAEYFISMRPGWLCYRYGQSVTLERYQPNRTARQFGLSQATAYEGLPLLPGVTDVSGMNTVPAETRMYVASLMWIHLLRLGTGSRFRIAPPGSLTGVSYTRLTWVKLSYAPFMEHGARKYERRVRSLGAPRGQRSRRGSAQARTSEGRQNDQHATEGTISSPSRVRTREPSPSYANVPSSGRRRVRSRPMEPPRASADWTASPLPQQLLPQDEVPFDSYRMSVDARHVPFDDYERGFSSMHIPSPIPEAGSSFVETLFPTDPSSSYWPGETSAARESPPAGGSGVSEYTPSFFELAPVVEAPVIDSPPAHFMESSTLPEGADYQSEIFCHIPRFPDTRNTDMRDQSVQFLREVISRLHPGSPESLDQFMNTANATLGVLAQVGLESEDMTYLEGLCREVEFYVRRLKSLSIIRTRVLLPDLREKVRIRREAADAAHDKFTKSADAMRRYNQRSASTSAEVDKLSSKIKNLWREIRDSMSCKVDLQAELEGQTRIIERERNRYQICHRALQDAEAALTQASEELHVAETEYQTLAEIMSQLQDLQSRLL
ncbi:hypothetical protein M5K25_019854 [Dendrobium thyrsiflorum]|uniref:Aminotransferase-like plant mobile domain-containing protein n=1 Tax=Dendrobium thyrsiflorum TaxID=117978 RepID=A0ABD0UMX5_DENTH